MKRKYRHDEFPTMCYTSNRFETDWRLATVVNRISPYSYHQSMEFGRGGKKYVYASDRVHKHEWLLGERSFIMLEKW